MLVLLYFTENALKEWICIGCSSWVDILCLVLFVHWNLKKTLKNLKTFSKKPSFFQPCTAHSRLMIGYWRDNNRPSVCPPVCNAVHCILHTVEWLNDTSNNNWIRCALLETQFYNYQSLDWTYTLKFAICWTIGIGAIWRIH